MASPLQRRRPGDVVVLLYHRVADTTREIDVPPSLFEEQMRALATLRRTISLDEALAGGAGVVITFDDGSDDLFENAFPLLQELRLPATLYLATGAVAETGPGLSWPSLRALAGTCITIGAHTHTHANLAHADEADIAAELDRCKHAVEGAVGLPCRHFAYPWAMSSPTARALVKERFASAASAAWRTNHGGIRDPYEIGRVPVMRSDGSFFFRVKSEGRLDAEGWAYRVARRGPWRRW
ncbi:MAG: polysaccharide deacetylase family protein [Actinomycetota bacterium]